MVELITKLFSIMSPMATKNGRAEEARLHATVDGDTGEQYTYADITEAIPDGTEIQFKADGKVWVFNAQAKGTTAFEGGKPATKNYYKLISFNNVDESQLAQVLG